jgi:hypothetical protein
LYSPFSGERSEKIARGGLTCKFVLAQIELSAPYTGQSLWVTLPKIPDAILRGGNFAGNEATITYTWRYGKI